MKTVNYLLVILLSLNFSCDDNESFINDDSRSVPNLEDDYEYYPKYIETFSMGLARVLNENNDVRNLIKNEALKKINYDYDVIYLLIKDEILDNGNTLEDLMLKYLDRGVLDSIETMMPNLTIFVPQLPENSFSAELWNIDKDIPVVGFIGNCNNDVYYYDSEGEKSILSSDLIPGFPIVVIKENERIVADLYSTKLDSEGTIELRSKAGIQFSFLNSAFNNLDSTNNVNEYSQADLRSSRYTIPDDLKKVFDAYDIFASSDGWQRDYIYYDLTPSKTKGPINNKHKECIVGFQMIGDPRNCLNKIADQQADPRLDGKWHKHPNPEGGSTGVMNGWTDGEFEFKVKVYWGTKSPVGTEYVTYFRVAPQQLFKVESTKTYLEDKSAFTIKSISLLMTTLSLPLFEWDLDKYSSSIKIAIEEVDLAQTVKQTATSSSEFATNFGFDASYGERVKIGLKFGSSTKEVRTMAYEVSTTYGNDELGEVIINFEDDIIYNRDIISSRNSRGSFLHPNYNNKYQTGWYKLYIAPKTFN